jgi:hypothetical protein
MTSTTTQADPISRFCNTVMHAVANAISRSGRKVADFGQACEVMREETKAFFANAEYAEERTALLRGSVSAQTVMTSLVASCMQRIELE